MKSASGLKRNILELTAAAQAANEAQKLKEKARIVKRMKHLKMCASYLESGATEEFIKKERDRVANRINLFLEAFKEPDERLPIKEVKLIKKTYEKDMGIPALRKQMSALNFILN